MTTPTLARKIAEAEVYSVKVAQKWRCLADGQLYAGPNCAPGKKKHTRVTLTIVTYIEEAS